MVGSYIFKLNIYSMLLTVILTLAMVIEFNVEVLCNAAWKVAVFAVVWGYTAVKTLKIYGRFSYKLKTLQRLVEKGREKYDYRLFYPYMGSPCMRNVVYFALCELNRQKDYRTIRHDFFAGKHKLQSHTAGRVVRVVSGNGALRFEVKNESGQWEEMN